MLQAPLTRFFLSHSFSKSLLNPGLRWVRSTGKPSSGPALPCCLWAHPCPSKHCTPPQASAAVSGLTQAYTPPPSLLCPHAHSPAVGRPLPPQPPGHSKASHRTVPLLTLQRRGREGAREEISPSWGQKPLIPSQPHPFHEVGRGSD